MGQCEVPHFSKIRDECKDFVHYKNTWHTFLSLIYRLSLLLLLMMMMMMMLSDLISLDRF